MRWEELTGDQFPQAVEQTQGVCLLPLSVIERHGHHLPLGTDTFIARDLCLRAAELEPVMIFPDMIFTQIFEAQHVQGTIAIDPDLILRMLDSVCREIARNGMKKIIIVNGHGGNDSLLPLFGQFQLATPRDYAVFVADTLPLPEDREKLEDLRETQVDGHAGEIESSMIMAIRPDLVRREALHSDDEGMPLHRLKALRDMGVYTGIWWYADHPTHYRGDGTTATAQKGEMIQASRARKLAEAIRAIKADTETLRLQEEFFSKRQHA